jgi:molybdopterin-guanine dinucleotide biosynthesis protein A
MKLAAVVLAGGESRRFGADKLSADLDGLSLLERALMSLPVDAELIIVGPERPIGRSARYVREVPLGSGPAAALVAGLATALSNQPDAIVVLPGDAPRAGHAALALLAELCKGDTSAVMATDASGRLQPLQFALTPEAAESLIASAGDSAGAGQSAQRLVEPLNARLVVLASQDHFDIDTTDQLIVWRQQFENGSNPDSYWRRYARQYHRTR